MVRPRSNTPVIGVLGFVLLLVFLYTSTRNGSQASEKIGTHPGQSDASHIDPIIDLSRLIPTTRRVAGLWGYNVFDNLYISEGSYIAVSDDLENTPDHKEVVGPGEVTFSRIGTAEAEDDLGTVVGRLSGTTFIFNDPPGPDGYMIYHNNFLTELFTGGWKALSLAPPHSLHINGSKSAFNEPGVELNTLQTGNLPDLPSRWMFPKCGEDATWNDGDSKNVRFLASVAPGATFEERNVLKLLSLAGQTVMLDRAVIVDRKAAHAARGLADQWGKMNAVIAPMPARLDFMDPVRENVIAGLQAYIAPVDKPVVVYVDNQGEHRKLAKGDHETLIEALHTLTDVAEVHVSQLKQMDPKTRLELLSRASIILSVHDEKLIQAMWMPATTFSSVIEILDEGGFAPDWYVFSTLLGHYYYPIHNDHVFEKPEKRVTTPGFDAGSIRVDGHFVAALIRDIIVNPAGGGSR
ncbi:hypothetical protein HD553DRAFT_341131 [Filobasidium floriforme]|uniref:uncharacterized protein n=1 Tax=Filobasidium floriforme TaxID=5210 RepID=UPI001E8E9993|nr:uncharacterized protein HD553DRAFT_341131 [Filobasidium floriforme]KAH8086295.1 hypothetical protein HD553DRAFT_341131 [Filobasidium floriforme]